MDQSKEVRILVPGEQPMIDLLGHRDELLKVIESHFKSDILVRGNEITITGKTDEVQQTSLLFEELLKLLAQGQELTTHNVGKTIEMISGSETTLPSELYSKNIISHRGKVIRPKTAGQKRYVEAINQKTLVFAVGPAGTGKTYLAMAMAVKALKNKEVSRIILTRPAVEAGERLGFLPGDIVQKVDPYLRPLYDALYDMMDAEQYQRLMERGTIEVAPLAFMRGRTLNDSFIILDEAQNTTPEQIKMFLTRLGFGSKAVVTGDITQTDLPIGQKSGLKIAREILAGIKDLAFIELNTTDVVRHELVQKIVEAYNRYHRQMEEESGQR